MTDSTTPEAASAAAPIAGIPPELQPNPLTAAEEAAIVAHLAELGLEDFSDPEGPPRFYAWVRELLGPALCAELEELRQRRGREGASRYTDDVAYFEAFSAPLAARALQSMRYDYFRQVGPRVVRHLPSEGTVVDLGCCTGTLTNFYASQRPDLAFLGLDRVPAPLKSARRNAASFGLKNVHFDAADVLRLIPTRNAAAAISTTAFWRLIGMDAAQRKHYDSLETQVARARMLQGNNAMRYNASVMHTIMQSVKIGGTLILMERLPDNVNAEALRILHALAGFTEVAFEPVVAVDDGVRQVFGMLVLERGEPPTHEKAVLTSLASDPEPADEATA